ncbi:hypothetical protein JT097_04035 [Helicobacter pylori]|nr:hypothetical protein [Helicobacter pylori]MCQ2857096.1 hypothetical protein [Helicobacter pylori]
MVEEIKVGGGLVLALCPYVMGILQGLSVQSAFNPTRLKKSSRWIVGVKSVSLLGLNVL